MGNPTSRRSPYARFLIQVALCFGLGCVLLPAYVELFPLGVLPFDYAVWRGQRDFADGAVGGPDPLLVILGDSRAHAAIRPREISPTARSIAFPGASPIELHSLLEHYLAHRAPPEALVVSVSPIHLREPRVFWRRTVRWSFVPLPELLDVFAEAERLGDDVLGDVSSRRLLARWLRTRAALLLEHAPSIRSSKLLLRRAPNQRIIDDLDAAAGYRPYRDREACDEPNWESELTGFAPSPLLDHYLRRILQLAQAHGIAVRMQAMPMNEASYARLHEGFRRDYERYVEGLAADFTEVTFAMDLWALPDDHFGDRSHVNLRGAEAVTTRLREPFLELVRTGSAGPDSAAR